MGTRTQHEMSGRSAEALRPLFVLSVWRSGSSLLYTLLNQHSQIALLYEANLPLLQPFFWGRSRSNAWLERWEFWNQSLSRHRISVGLVPADLPDAWAATRSVYQSVACRKQASIWGEKTPSCYDRALFLADKFPDARFIVIWRDLHAVLRSLKRASNGDAFFKKVGLSYRVLLGNENLREACGTLIAQGRLVYEVDYEDLTSNTCECMKQMCQFLEIPFEPRLDSLEGADRSAIFPGEHHAMVRGTVISGDRKQTEILPAAVRAKIDRYVCRWRRRYGGAWPRYPLEVPEGTSPPRFAEVCKDRVIYHGLRLFDQVTVMIYSVAPLSLLRLYRSLDRHKASKGSHGQRREVNQ